MIIYISFAIFWMIIDFQFQYANWPIYPFYNLLKIMYNRDTRLFYNYSRVEGEFIIMVRKTFKMRVSRNRTISINGSILDVDVTHDEFLQEFVEWVDSKGWSFMGMTDEITPEEASQKLIDSLIDEKDKKE